MKKINKKLVVILLSGFVLMTGCKNNNELNTDKTVKQESEPKQTVTSKPTQNNEESSKEIVTEEIKEKDIEENTNIETTPDEQITTYVNELNDSIDIESIKEKAIEKFIVLTDFIFYDTKINGIKFNDLTEGTKKEILDVYYVIDNKIETKFPDYKETIADKYNIATSYLTNKYNEISDKLKEKTMEKIGEDNYNNISETNKEITEQDKENLQIIKEKAEETTDKAKTKVKSWYEDLKNKY